MVTVPTRRRSPRFVGQPSSSVTELLTQHLAAVRCMLVLVTGVVSWLAFTGVTFAAGGPLANGSNNVGTITTQTDLWTFPASTGDGIVLSVSEVGANSPFQPWLLVTAPDGSTL